jgi:pimeloyl-ACP methyl ester carboxylesterase
MQAITSSDGTTIAFERSGKGPPLVLVHGTTADHTRWKPAPATARGTIHSVRRRPAGPRWQR